jgi:flagellar assembly factor FliW
METKYFGVQQYGDGALVEFPEGLPGFERERRFLPLEMPDQHPLVFLQSAATPALCFVTLPVLAVERGYRLEVAPADLETLNLDPAVQPEIGRDVLVLAIVTVEEAGITANLLAPLVINLANGRAVQAICPTPRYSHRHALVAAEAAPCS